MSYATGTTFYNLPQTVGTDKRDWFDTNQAFADVDAALHTAVTGQAADAEAIAAINTQLASDEADIAALQATTSTHTSQIASLSTATSQNTSDIGDLRSDAEDMISAYNEGSAATSTRAYSAGDYFIYNDVLYKATTAIAIGDTIVPNTNCEATNVTTEISTLNSDKANKSDFNIIDVSSHFHSSSSAFSAVAKKCGNIISVEITIEGTITGGNHPLYWAVDEGYRPVVNFELGFSAVGSAGDTAKFVGANIEANGNGNMWFLDAVSGAKFSGTYICN